MNAKKMQEKEEEVKIDNKLYMGRCFLNKFF